MCEEKPAVEALSFLQNQVSSVVDHSNPKEAEVFRSLLTHLVMASPLDSLPTPDPEEDEREDEGEGKGAPPRKKSRGDSHSAGSPSTNGTRNGFHVNGMTNGLPTLRTATSLKPGVNLGVDRERLQASADPVEESSSPLSQIRFQQRNEVFESLLEFIGEDAKQPEGSLLDYMDVGW
jgi:muskelin